MKKLLLFLMIIMGSVVSVDAAKLDIAGGTDCLDSELGL